MVSLFDFGDRVLLSKYLKGIFKYSFIFNFFGGIKEGLALILLSVFGSVHLVKLSGTRLFFVGRF